jgi:hypothetical protein
MPSFKNSRGQEPSMALPDDAPLHPLPSKGQHLANGEMRMVPVMSEASSRFMQRLGHEPIDVTRCQAPNPTRRGEYEYERCPEKAVCVMVENAPRENGLIAAMALCELHRDALLSSKGNDYATVTPLGS